MGYTRYHIHESSPLGTILSHLIQDILSHPISLKNTATNHLSLGIPSGLFLSGILLESYMHFLSL